MLTKFLAHAVAGSALIAAPVAASARPAPATTGASLSVAKSVRVGTSTQKKSALAGGGILAAVILAGIVAIGIIAIVNDSDDSDSN